jgi:hypothetical protein
MDKFYSSQAASVYIAKFAIKPIYSEQVVSDLRHRIIAKSSHVSTQTLASTHLRQLLVVDHTGSSSPTSFVVIITDNHLHH